LGDRFVIGFYENNPTGDEEKKKNGDTLRLESQLSSLIRLMAHSTPPDLLKFASQEISPSDRQALFKLPPEKPLFSNRYITKDQLRCFSRLSGKDRPGEKN
jgi:hypothetical protein